MNSLAKDRAKGITNRLRMISDAPLYVEPRSTSGQFHLKARSGQKLTSDEQRSTFPSRVDSIICRYGEQWNSIRPDDQEFRLHTVSLHLLQHRGQMEEPKEVIAFHWHSVDGDDRYSNLPHLHVKAAPDPLPRSHLNVTLATDTDDQSTVEYLDRLLGEAISMVNAEVLQRIDARPVRW